MKKNAMLKIAAVLLVAVLLTTCFISSTFAKYTAGSKSVNSNTGTVATWGVSITGGSNEALGLFLNSYEENGKVVVDGATDSAIVIAPGTDNTLPAFNIGISGKPEVAYQIEVTADVELSGWFVNGTAYNGTVYNNEYYCPLAVTVGSETLYGNDYKTETDPVAAFEKAIEDEIAKQVLGLDSVTGDTDNTGRKYSQKYAPNTEIASTANNLAISWSWAFDAAEDSLAGIEDAKDSLLGDAHNSTISIGFSVAAEQVADLD